MIDKDTLLKHLREDVYCRVGASPIHGVGVFAIRAIPKGVDPLKSLVPRDEIELTSADLKGIHKNVLKQMEMFCFFEGDQILAAAHGLNTVDMAIYVNHSKDPNMELIAPGKFKTLRPVKEGEELSLDYDITFGETHIFE
jgi:SET domain-containing protein